MYNLLIDYDLESMMSEEVLYKKVKLPSGRHKYVPYGQFERRSAWDDYDSHQTFVPYGCKVTVSEHNKSSTQYFVNPEIVPFVAGAMILKDSIVSGIIETSKLRPASRKLTEDQRAAWGELKSRLNVYSLEIPSHSEVANAVLTAISNKA